MSGASKRNFAKRFFQNGRTSFLRVFPFFMQGYPKNGENREGVNGWKGGGAKKSKSDD
jgi:hypothetical protein